MVYTTSLSNLDFRCRVLEATVATVKCMDLVELTDGHSIENMLRRHRGIDTRRLDTLH